MKNLWKVCLIIFLYTGDGKILAQVGDSEAVSTSGEATQVEFSRDIVSIFVKNCVACHNAKKPEGGLSLESYESLMKGGDSGAAIEAGRPDAGYLLSRITDDSDPMPPEGNAVGAERLTEDEIARIRTWILDGASPPSPHSLSSFQWQPLPESIHPVYGLATSPDGNYLAVARGNQVLLLRSSETSEPKAFPLIDPKVAETLRQTTQTSVEAQATHLDIVQSIAFSPDSQMLATGGFRSVKLWQRRTQPVEQLVGAISHATRPDVSAISPDGRRMAAAHKGQLEIVDLPTAQSRRYLKAHESAISSLVWLGDSTQLLSVDGDGRFVLTDFDSHQSTRLDVKSTSDEQATVAGPVKMGADLVYLGHDRIVGIDEEERLLELQLDKEHLLVTAKIVTAMTNVTALAISGTASSDSESTATPVLAVGMGDGTCRLLNFDTGLVMKDIPTGLPVNFLSLSRNGDLLVSSDGSSPPKIWRVEDATCVATLNHDYRQGQHLAVAMRGTRRQQGLIDRLAARLDELTKAAAAEEEARAKVESARDKAAEDLASKESGVSMAETAVAQTEQAIVEAEAALAAAMKVVEEKKAELEAKQKAAEEARNQLKNSNEELAKRNQALATAQDAAARAAQKIPEMESLISVEKQRLDQFTVEQDHQVQRSEEPRKWNQLLMSSSGSQVVVADDEGKVHVYSVHNGSAEATLDLDSSVASAQTDPQGGLLVLTDTGSAVKWDLSFPWELQRSIGSFEASPWSDRITALDFSPDGKRLAVGSGPPSRFGEIKIVDVESGEVALDLGESHSDSVLTLKYSPDGRMLASAAADKLCRLFDAQTGQALGTLEGHTHHILTLAWKDDGVTLATGSADTTVKLWNVETGTQIRTIKDFKKEVTALAFVAQTDQIAAADAAGTCRLIEAGTGKAIKTFEGSDGTILALGISPDGTILFAGGQSGDYWAWQIEDAKKLK